MAKAGTNATSNFSKEEKVLPISTLIANDLNPRKIGKKQYEALKKSLQEFPDMKEMRPIIVDENLTILGGHQRVYALKDLGYTDVKILQVFGLTEAQKREFIIKDNTAAGEWDSDIMANLWDVKELEDWGIPKFNLGDIGDEADAPSAKDSQNKTHICPNCDFEFED